jgi:hypothetical protein
MRSRSVVLLGRDDERDDERARRVTENRLGERNVPLTLVVEKFDLYSGKKRHG